MLMGFMSWEGQKYLNESDMIVLLWIYIWTQNDGHGWPQTVKTVPHLLSTKLQTDIFFQEFVETKPFQKQV